AISVPFVFALSRDLMMMSIFSYSLFSIFLSSWESSLFPSFAQDLFGSVIFLLWRHMTSLDLLAIHPFSDVWFANLLSQL
ncbi:hypothetical protein, partial [Klebsiella pneumoniae]|uniref:hypothetical protein n=1 Tax=Klebsiella pneumoniae TaxID=573 RepID=UPI00358EC11C